MSKYTGSAQPFEARNEALAQMVDMSLDGASDRPPRGSQAGSRSGSQPVSPAGSRRGSDAGSNPPAKSNPFKQGMGYDPAKPEKLTPAQLVGKRVDLPADAYASIKGASRFAARPGYNTDGTAIKLQLNTFAVKQYPSRDVFQYDVTVRPNPDEKAALVKKCWLSKASEDARRGLGGLWLYDGHKLAWSSKLVPEQRITVDLDRESGRTPRAGGRGHTGPYTLVIKQTTKVRMQALESYLRGSAGWDESVLEAMNFLDHVMRQHPSESDRLIQIKRNFYPKAGAGIRENKLCDWLEVIKGTYSAFRLGDSIKNRGTGLSVNVDVSNTAFWCPGIMSEVALLMWRDSGLTARGNATIAGLEAALRPVKGPNDPRGQPIPQMSDAFKLMRRFVKLKFTVTHIRDKGNGPKKIYTVKRVMWEPSKIPGGCYPKTVKFMKKYLVNGREQEKEVTVYQHFVETYNIHLRHVNLPLVETEKGAFFPMEVCDILPFQRYQAKLDPDQTSRMIKIAVTRPRARKEAIMSGVNNLDWSRDPYLNAFGIDINPNMTMTDARVLKNPKVHFANGSVDPGTSGRWDLRGKKFIRPNTVPLTNWGIFVFANAVQMAHLNEFSQNFQHVYRSHGGVIQGQPVLQLLPNAQVTNGGEAVEVAYKAVEKAKGTPQMLFFVLPNKNQITYRRMKKSADCRYNVVSQMLFADHVKKNQGQYCSNVAMKVNAKMGGASTIVAPNYPQKTTYYDRPTMVIGLDVSHAPPGMDAPSMAAMSVSLDKHANRYAGACETNGHRKEVVGAEVMRRLFDKVLSYWMRINNNSSPQHIYYFRDGCAEGQFQQVLDIEVKALRDMFTVDRELPAPKLTVIVATKRHHIRFFPKPGDRGSADKNDNPLPGTLVEHDATHPFHWDFYLSSHSAIQGTARPVHYQVILDEARLSANFLQKMIYEQCYQFVRSTTPVSLHPAVYYAHIISNRAAAHEDIHASQQEMEHQGKQGFPMGKTNSEIYPDGRVVDWLVPMMGGAPANIQHINTTMWFI